MNFALRVVAVWLLIAVAETLHGIARVRFLNRRVGDRRARQIGVLTGSGLILAITWWTLPWMGVRSRGEAWQAGLVWLVLMLSFDLALGRWVFGFRWRRIGEDFDPTKGGFLGLGMLVLAAAPWLVGVGRGLIP